MTTHLTRTTALLTLLLVASGCAEQPRAGVGSDGIFRITPQRPVPELRAEALAAQPPAESGQFRAVDLVELTKLEPTIKLDIRYATTNNFLSAPVYMQAAAYMQRPAAEAVVRVHRALASQGYGLLIHDAYRPWWVTKVFWEATPPSMREFVADPAQGSRHNRGCAVDLTLYDLRTGKAVQMPGVYDEMSPRCIPTTPAANRPRASVATCCDGRWSAKAFRSTTPSGGTSISTSGGNTRSSTGTSPA